MPKSRPATTVTVVACCKDPLVPTTSIMNVPGEADTGTVTFIAEVTVASADRDTRTGLNVTETPSGRRLVDRSMDPEKWSRLPRVIVELWDEPRGITSIIGSALTLKSGGTTETATPNVSDEKPLVPVIVTV